MTLPSHIIGHQQQLAQLAKDIEAENIAHAYLISGTRYLGKMDIARWFVGAVITNTMEEEEKEKHLSSLKKNIHSDLLVLDQLWIDGSCTDWDVIAHSSNIPQQHRAKAKAKTNTIGIDDIRSLQEQMHETASTGRRCCIIRSIERLHITAANALLKLLEEPPAGAIFCCTTESLSAIPETIVSRMRTVKCYPVPRKELAPIVESLPEEDKNLLLDIAEGCPGIIKKCMNDPEQLRAHRQMHIDTRFFLETESLIEKNQQLQQVIEKDRTKEFFQHILLHLRQDLRSEDEKTVIDARKQIHSILSFLKRLQTNAQKQLLALDATLACSNT